MKTLKCMYHGTEQILPCTEDMIQWAKENALNGEYTIEDDGQPDPVEAPSQLDVIEAQVFYTAMQTDTLIMAE